MDYVRRAMWDMVHADDPCIVSRSPWGLAKIMEIVVGVCRAFDVTIFEKKTTAMCMTIPRTPRTTMRVGAVAQTYQQV